MRVHKTVANFCVETERMHMIARDYCNHIHSESSNIPDTTTRQQRPQQMMMMKISFDITELCAFFVCTIYFVSFARHLRKQKYIRDACSRTNLFIHHGVQAGARSHVCVCVFVCVMISSSQHHTPNKNH